MNTQDKLTQLYADAFSDYTETPPQEVYSKVRKELNRKSLLTLDPTRLNVFYLALLSGVAALALVNLNTANTAETEVSPLPSTQETVFAVNLKVDKTEEVEIEDAQIGMKLQNVSSLEEAKYEASENSMPIEESYSEESEQISDDEVVNSEIIEEKTAETPEVSIIPDESVTVDPIEVSDIEVKQSWSVENATVESPEDLLRALRFDEDKNANLGIKKK